MSEAREQSYYEIALTNRQVMSIFIVLLVCLLASFVSGVWIGRQGAGVRVQTADAQLIESGRAEGEPSLGEMDFFSNREGAGERDEGAPAEPSSSSSGSVEPAGQGESTGSTPAAEPPPAAAVRPDPPPAASRPSSQPATPAAETPATDQAPANPAGGGDFLYIQVFSSLDRDQAQSIVERLRQDGYAVFLSSVEVESRLMHRVRIGPYTERAEAEGVAQTVQRKHKLSTWITP